MTLFRGPQLDFTDINEDRLAKETTHALGAVTGIDLTTTGVTTVFTAPSGKIALIFGVLLEATDADTVTVVPQISLGLNPSTTNIFPTETLINFDTTGDLYLYWANVHKAVTVVDGGILDLDVVMAATATTLDVTARILGILF